MAKKKKKKTTTKPIKKLVKKAVTKSKKKTTATKPAAKKKTQLKKKAKPTPKKKSVSRNKAASKPVSKPVAKPVAKPASKPVAKPERAAPTKTITPSLPQPQTHSPAEKTAFVLGRPKITGEERLDLLFHKDYEARSVFEFLNVRTVKELEQFPPQEIVKRLSQPIRRTVDRIRQELAQRNRCLAGDEEFVHKHKEKGV